MPNNLYRSFTSNVQLFTGHQDNLMEELNFAFFLRSEIRSYFVVGNIGKIVRIRPLKCIHEIFIAMHSASKKVDRHRIHITFHTAKFTEWRKSNDQQKRREEKNGKICCDIRSFHRVVTSFSKYFLITINNPFTVYKLA